jgi:hypothetical protein
MYEQSFLTKAYFTITSAIYYKSRRLPPINLASAIKAMKLGVIVETFQQKDLVLCRH